MRCSGSGFLVYSGISALFLKAGSVGRSSFHDCLDERISIRAQHLYKLRRAAAQIPCIMETSGLVFDSGLSANPFNLLKWCKIILISDRYESSRVDQIWSQRAAYLQKV